MMGVGRLLDWQRPSQSRHSQLLDWKTRNGLLCGFGLFGRDAACSGPSSAVAQR